MTTSEEYRENRHEYDEPDTCPCCHFAATDAVDREDGHHYLKCACGKVRFEYDEEEEPEKVQLCQSCEDDDAKFKVVVLGLDAKELDSLLLCEYCAREESWHIRKTGKLESA